MASFVQATKVRKRAHELDRRVTSNYLDALDRHLEDVLERSAKVWNGGRRTLDATVLAVVIGARR